MASFASAEWNAGLAHSGNALRGQFAENGMLTSGGPAGLVYYMGLVQLHACIFQGKRAAP